MSYDGPIFDSYFHPDWSTKSSVLGERKAFLRDPMRRRMMETFRLDREAAGSDARVAAGFAGTVAAMDEAGVACAILQATLQYPTAPEVLEAGVAEHHAIVEGHPGRFLHSGTILPPPQGPATYWDLIEPARTVADHHARFGIVGVHLLNAA